MAATAFEAPRGGTTVQLENAGVTEEQEDQEAKVGKLGPDDYVKMALFHVVSCVVPLLWSPIPCLQHNMDDGCL